MLDMCRKYKVLAVLAGHFHRELWHMEQDGTHHVIAPGITLSRGDLGWVIYDVYPDRVVQRFKPLWNAHVAEGQSENHITGGPLTFAGMPQCLQLQVGKHRLRRWLTRHTKSSRTSGSPR